MKNMYRETEQLEFQSNIQTYILKKQIDDINKMIDPCATCSACCYALDVCHMESSEHCSDYFQFIMEDYNYDKRNRYEILL